MARKTKYRQRIEELIDRRNEQLMKEQTIQEVVTLYKPAFDDKPWYKRLKEFIKAENQLGKLFGIAIDIWGFFNPKVKEAEDYVRKHVLPRLK